VPLSFPSLPAGDEIESRNRTGKEGNAAEEDVDADHG
jgi:hypothetical protein